MDPLASRVVRRFLTLRDPLTLRVARRFLAATADLWSKAQEDLRTFNERYKEAQRLREPLDESGTKLLNDFAFRKNGTAPSFIGTDFQVWMSKSFRMDIDDPEAARPNGSMILEVADGKKPLRVFLSALDTYRDALQAVVAATAPTSFTYQGFQVENPQHLGDELARHILEGVDYLVALFKKRGLEKLLKNEIRRIEIVPEFEGIALGYYYTPAKTIALSAKLVGLGTGRFMKWVNEAFLHEFGHHIHLNYLAPEAKAEWDSGWSEVKEKKEVIELAFSKITREERVTFYNLLKTTDWDTSRAAKKLDAVQRVKFGVWLRSPMTGGPLITDKQFRLTKDGQYIAFYMNDPGGFMKKNYDMTPDEPTFRDKSKAVARRIADKLGLLYGGNYGIPSSVVEELSKADPSMQKSVEEALEKLQIVSPYGKTNEMEDFAESFVAFVGAPEKLTPTAKFRMQRALSLSGLYGKPVMRLAGPEWKADKPLM